MIRTPLNIIVEVRGGVAEVVEVTDANGFSVDYTVEIIDHDVQDEEMIEEEEN